VERERSDPADRPPLAPEGDDAGLVVSFAVGPSGVGPVMGFGTDDFFPVVPVADSSVDEPTPGADADADAQSAP
jgi:hypothetical protein